MDYRQFMYDAIVKKKKQLDDMPESIDKELLKFEIDDMSDNYRRLCYDYRDPVSEECLPC